MNENNIRTRSRAMTKPIENSSTSKSTESKKRRKSYDNQSKNAILNGETSSKIAKKSTRSKSNNRSRSSSRSRTTKSSSSVQQAPKLFLKVKIKLLKLCLNVNY